MLRPLSALLVATLLTLACVSVHSAASSPSEISNLKSAIAPPRAAAAPAPLPRHQAVLELKPAGYWPADDGSGEVLRDLSPRANHGRIRHVPWTDGLLDFTAAYQWAEIPPSPAYQTPAFSLGGWLHARTPFEGGGWPNTGGMLFFGHADWQARFGIQLCVRKQENIEIASHGRADALGTRRWDAAARRSLGEPVLSLGRWHHLLYTFEPVPSATRPPASPDLARDAQASATDVSDPRPLIDGDPATAWLPSAPGTSVRLAFPAERTINLLRLRLAPGSSRLPGGRFEFSDGTSLRVGPVASDWKVLFLDKKISWLSFTPETPATPAAQAPALATLSAHKEPVQIFAEEGVLPAPSSGSPLLGRGSLYVDGHLVATRDDVPYLPAKRPLHIGPDAMWWHQVDLKSGSLDGSVRDLVWFDRALSFGDVSRIHAATTPDRGPAPAAPVPDRSLLPAADTPGQRAALLARLTAPDDRAAAVAALALAKARAPEAVPALAAALEKLLAADPSPRAPRVEDLRRNALLRAILDLAPEEPSITPLLDRALVRPLIALHEPAHPDLRAVRAAHATGRPLEAYRLLLKLRPADPAQNFFTHREPGNRDYTSVTRHRGTTYQINAGVAWRGGEKLSPADHAALAARVPGFAAWRPANYPHLYRIPLVKIDASGRESRTYLGGPDFVLDGEDEKLRGWSLFIDRAGHIHLFGGQHNTPNPDLYAPGTWEKLPASRDRHSPDFPAQMYWVSRRPGDFADMEFVGRKSDPRRIPATYLNYMSLVQSPAGDTYLYGRTDALGWQSWGAYRHDSEARRWRTVGGDPYEVYRDAFATHPEWRRFLHDPIRGKVVDAPTEFRVLAWAWQPPFYNFCRDDWGLRFDRTGRLHAHLQISGLDLSGRVIPSSVYAWSDDGGATFHRADGSPVRLPLTLNPAPAHHADLQEPANLLWWETWFSLVPAQGARPGMGPLPPRP